MNTQRILSPLWYRNTSKNYEKLVKKSRMLREMHTKCIWVKSMYMSCNWTENKNDGIFEQCNEEKLENRKITSSLTVLAILTLLCFGDRDTLCRSGRPRNNCVGQTDLKLTEI